MRRFTHSVSFPADLLALLRARALANERTFNQEVMFLVTCALPEEERLRLHHVKRQAHVLAEAELTLTAPL